MTPSEPIPDPATAWRPVARERGLEDVVAALPLLARVTTSRGAVNAAS